MCGRFARFSPVERFARLFGVGGGFTLTPRYNIVPGNALLLARISPEHGERELVSFQWGLVPPWAKDPRIGNRMINARAETVAEKPAFRAAFKRKRCLIAFDGFYEWKRPVGPGPKQPYFLRLRDGEPAAFAGLYERWQGTGDTGDPVVLPTCTILTTQANAVVAPIHDRMPLIVEPADFDRWLDPRRPPTDLLRPFRPDRMEAYPVSTRVNQPDHDDADCIAPLTAQR